MSARWSSWIAWLRRSIPTIVGGVLAAAVVAFVFFSIWWFLEVANDKKDLSAGDAFVGLGYFAGVVLVVLFVWMSVRYLTGVSRSGGSASPTHLDQDRYIVVTQLRLGVLLIVFGAAVGIIFGLAFDDNKGVALALGTAALGAGAAMLPGGASAQASNRLKDKAAAVAAGADEGAGSEPATPEAVEYDQQAHAEHPDHPANDMDAGSAEVEGEPELVGADEAVEGTDPPVLDDTVGEDGKDGPADPPDEGQY
jgi:hypothetical protein